jgi:hypothetical protein
MAYDEGLARRYVEALKTSYVREMDVTGRPNEGFRVRGSGRHRDGCRAGQLDPSL